MIKIKIKKLFNILINFDEIQYQKIHEKYDLSFKRVNSSNTNLQIYVNFALILCLTYIKLKNLYVI